MLSVYPAHHEDKPMPQIGPHTMIVGDVAATLGVSTTRVKQLDDELQPIRGRNGHRRYDPSVVAAVAAKRAR